MSGGGTISVFSQPKSRKSNFNFFRTEATADIASTVGLQQYQILLTGHS